MNDPISTMRPSLGMIKVRGALHDGPIEGREPLGRDVPRLAWRVMAIRHDDTVRDELVEEGLGDAYFLQPILVIILERLGQRPFTCEVGTVAGVLGGIEALDQLPCGVAPPPRGLPEGLDRVV